MLHLLIGETMLNLAGVHEPSASFLPEIHTVELVCFVREAGDEERVSVPARRLDPVLIPAWPVATVLPLRDNALQFVFARVPVNAKSALLQMLAEPNRAALLRTRQQLLEHALALNQRHLSEVTTVQVQEVESIVDDVMLI